MLRPGLAALVVVALAAPGALVADPKTVAVKSPDELRTAVAAARPGTRIEIAAGDYGGGWHFRVLRGAEGRPIVLAAKDPRNPPEFKGGGSGIHLTGAVHVELAGLAFSGQTGNGVNVDDGGERATPTHHVVLRGLTVRDVGPDGNCDGIKLSGLTEFRVEDCTVERWGRGGSAVDMVGCSAGVIEGCTLRHSSGAAGASGVQMKGGTRVVAVRRCRFENAGSRAVNAGGSTGLAYFRPPLAGWKGPKYEAKDVVVEGCTFVGSDAPVAFVGVDGAKFRFNTVYLPNRWLARILQENRAEGFVPSRRGEIADNLIVFRSDRWSEGGVNRGDGTEPATFVFARNFWFCADAPGRTRELLRLPDEEKDGVHGKDPAFVDAEKLDLRLRSGSPAKGVGAEALRD